MTIRITAIVCVATMLALCSRIAAGQQSERRRATVVSYIAGQDVYVGLGREDGLVAGDTVVVEVVRRRHGSLRVVSTSSRKAVLTFAGKPFAISRGDRLVLVYRPHTEAVVATTSADKPRQATPERASIMEGVRPAGRSRQAPRARVDGRLTLGVQTMSSATRPSPDSEEMTRSFSTPSARLHMRVRDLPGGLSINAHVAASYRNSSGPAITPRFLPRLYRLSVVKDLGLIPGAVEVGRFYSPFENFSGYWDGVLVHMGTGGFGGGVATGFQPDRSNVGFGPDLPKYTVFAHLRQDLAGAAYATDVSVHTVRPRNGLLNHTFVGWRQAMRKGRLVLSTEVQADEDPEQGEWVITRMIGRASIPAGPLRVRVGYSQRRPYSIWRPTGVISYRRDRVDGGVQFLFGTSIVGLSVASNTLEGSDPYVSYQTFFSVPRGGPLGIGFGGSATYWSRDDFTATSASFTLSRRARTVSPQAGYQYYRTLGPGGAIVTHAVNVSVSLRFSHDLGGRIQSRTQFGELLFSQSFNLGFWVSF